MTLRQGLSGRAWKGVLSGGYVARLKKQFFSVLNRAIQFRSSGEAVRSGVGGLETRADSRALCDLYVAFVSNVRTANQGFRETVKGPEAASSQRKIGF
ncbi:hypothetical protein [Streptomyces albidoflavus]|uniref:hypothetical protein n=1 Tax=Streptomyces albidoflavus TaxID=1886 RepID=UPI0034000BFE